MSTAGPSGGAAGAADAPFEAPRYGAGSLADLAPSVLASLGVRGEPNVLGLPPVRRACVLLIDGMGWELLLAHREHAPFLSSLIDAPATRPALTAAFPTTTATSLTTFGTGAVPGHHGIVGYKVVVPGTDTVLNQLRWGEESGVDPEEWQPLTTAYQRAERAGVTTGYVASAAYEHSRLTRATARGSGYLPADDLTSVAVRTAAALTRGERSLVFAYHPDLDGYGHRFGIASDHWRIHLGQVDRLVEQIAGALPPDAALYITADHGMVDSDPAQRVDLEADPELRRGVRVVAGEARMRQVYTEPGATEDVRAAWAERLGPAALVLTREEAVAAGYYGPATDGAVRERIGDVLAVARGSATLVLPEAEPLESGLVGQHGSLTPAELSIPLLAATTVR
ncbi:alkaline phosphatase family protein [Nocardiopsis composta]|uniref:Putative AlkP superfamily pyrophosphatase or phosphodiesterase n=1 Tax=Nocardiopsis composta TaxID=157465 RepID=A0A7W8QSP2_9ACTN|nr:nucleotide pyrophosphatase/phosphodiesterase family protein [Nocardiopsis composta]MBB5435434.1 putative AlkP superfamily pyrophosphatase or phosphodiesterase [Nocardiopsis composta]